MKKRKLNLRELAVESFVTNMETSLEDAVKGGVTNISSAEAESIYLGCETNLIACGTFWNCG
ncbi:MAG: pinensin family lanthipeptide [Bacteroidota bacterium]